MKDASDSHPLEDARHEIQHAHGNAAGQEEDVAVESTADGLFEHSDLVGADTQILHLAAGGVDQCAEHRAVAVADLPCAGCLVCRDQFVAGREYRDAGAVDYLDRWATDFAQ